MAHGQTDWTGGAGPGDFTNSSNWNSGAPLNQQAIVDTSSGTVTIFLTSPTPNPYSINGLTVQGSDALIFNQNSGTLAFASGVLDFGTSNSIYNLTGTASALQVGGAGGITGTGTLSLAGGTLQVINSNLGVGANVTTTLATGIFSSIDTNNLGATLSGTIDGATGGLNKIGLGDLALKGASNTIGSFGILGGSVTQSTGTLTASELAVGTGTGDNGSYDMTGGTLIFTTGTPPAIVGGIASSFRVGDFGGTGTFTLSGGSIIDNGSMDIGNQGGVGTLNVTGGTLDLAGPGTLYALGRTTSSATSASTGIMNISGTAVVTLDSGKFIIGDRDSSGLQGNGILTQTGGTFTIDNGAGLYLSAYGTGVYNLTGGILQIGGTSLNGNYNGAAAYQFNFAGGTIQVIGSTLVSNVDMNLGDGVYSVIDTNGLGATLSGTINGATGGLYKVGAGNLALNGSNNTIGSFLVAGGSVSQSTGTLTTTELAVGTGAGNTGSYNMTGGTLLFPTGPLPLIIGATATASSFRIGDFGGTGTFTQSGGSVIVMGGMDIGNQGGSGTYDISGGALDFSGGLYALGRTTSSGTTASTGIMNISGTAVITVHDGNFIIGDRDASGPQGTGMVNQSGGTFTIDGGAGLFLSAYGAGTYNLTGGILQIGGTSLNGHYNGTVAYQFNFAGGTIQVIGSTLVSNVDMNLGDGVYSVIDTNGLGATLNGTINGSTGGLFKMGTGDLALRGSTNTIGSFLIAGGSVTQSTGTLTTTELAVGTGTVTGTPGGLANTGSYTLSGGTLVFPGGATPAIVGGGSSNSFRIGDFGGTGIFTQTAGMVVLGTPTGTASLAIGNKGGNGTYNLQGGTLTLAGPGYIDLGLSTSTSYGPTSGIMNISGGTLEIGALGYLAIGDNNAGVPADMATGVINQTGGTIIIDAGGKFDLSAYGTGTYNFDGGVLEVGGADLQARFAAGAPTTNFNLGGGMIQVMGSDLSVDADATLVGTTTSTIDTGSLNATWTGSLTGSGNLAKTGTGSLTLANINTTGLFDLQNGTAVSSSASNAIGQLYVDGGNTANLQVNAGKSLTITPVSTTTAGRIYENSTLNIFGGGTVNIEGSFGVGRPSVANPGDGSSGTLNILGSTQLNFDYSGYTNMFVGAGAGVAGTQGTVNQMDASKVILGSNMIIGADNATAIYNLADTATLTTSASPTATIYIGLNQDSADTAGTTSGTLNITGSATFSVGQGSQLFVGAGDNRAGDEDDASFGAAGTIIQNGAGSVVTLDTGSNSAWFGVSLTDTPGSITGGNGTYELDAGTLNIESGNVAFGASAGASGYLNQTGGTLTAATAVLIGNSGTGAYNMSGGTATFQNGLTVGNNSGSVGTINQTAGVISLTGGSLDLKQSASDYNLSGGQLVVGGSGVTGAGQLNINGGNLSGNGLITAATVVSDNGTITPGSTTSGIHTPGLLTFTNLSLNSSSIYAWSLANESMSGAGANFDEIQASAGGSILLDGSLTFNLSFGSGINFADAFWTTMETWDVIDASASGASLTGSATYVINAPGATGGTFSAIQMGNQVDLIWTPVAVPEPSTWLLLGVGAVILFFLRRKREI